MTLEEKKEVIKFSVEVVNKRVPVIAGTGTNNTKASIELSKYAEEVGADMVLIITPYYNKTSQKGLYAHFSAINDAINNIVIKIRPTIITIVAILIKI